MKKNMKKIIATSGLVGTMLATTLAGCKNEDKIINETQMESQMEIPSIEEHAEIGVIAYSVDGQTIKRVVQCVFKDDHQARYESITNPQLSVIYKVENYEKYYEIYEEENLVLCNDASLGIIFGAKDYTYDDALQMENEILNIEQNDSLKLKRR